MIEKVKLIIHEHWANPLSKSEFIKRIKSEIGDEKEDFIVFFEKVIQRKNADELDYAMSILWVLEEENEFVNYVHKLILEPWHRKYEDLAHDLQERKLPESIPFLKKAIQMKFEYLEEYETGTDQFINQCGHALRSIGTEEAIDVIRELAKSDDPIIKKNMIYRLEKIERQAKEKPLKKSLFSKLINYFKL